MSTGVTTDSDLLQGVNASLSFNQDGSKSLNTGANLKIPIQTPVVYIEINLGLGFSMNSYSGATLSTHGGACVGEAGTCVGMEDGGSLYFDRSGGFSGMTVYTELYLQIAGEGRISTGYEAGLLGAEGRGAYAGASAFGVHAEVSHLEKGYDGVETNWGFEERAYLHAGKIGEISADKKSQNVGLEIWVPSLGELGHFGIGDTYDVSGAGIQKKQREEITKLLLGVNDDLLAILNKEWDSNELGGKLSHKSVVRLNSWLVKNGFERVDYANMMHGKNSQKLTWRHKGSSEYGNLEIIMPAFPNNVKDHPEWSGAFASYNYGNNMISHFFIDVLW